MSTSTVVSMHLVPVVIVCFPSLKWSVMCQVSILIRVSMFFYWISCCLTFTFHLVPAADTDEIVVGCWCRVVCMCFNWWITTALDSAFLSLLSSNASLSTGYMVCNISDLCTGTRAPSPLLDNIWVMVIVWRLRGNIIRTARCWIVWHNVHSPQHTYVSSSYRSNRLSFSRWDLYVVHRGGCLELYYCNMVEWFWWNSSLNFDDQLVPVSALTPLIWSSGL